MILSNQLKEEYNRISALHTFGAPSEFAPVRGNLTIDIKDGTIKEALAKCEEYIKNPENKLFGKESLISVV